jgi:hypothetical protein
VVYGDGRLACMGKCTLADVEAEIVRTSLSDALRMTTAACGKHSESTRRKAMRICGLLQKRELD